MSIARYSFRFLGAFVGLCTARVGCKSLPSLTLRFPCHFHPCTVVQSSGIRCLAGFYCLGGSAAPAACSAAAGFYCPEGSSLPAGIQCDAGYYCEGGSVDKSPCTAAQGKYCAGGAETPDGNEQCPAGWYCAGQPLPQVKVITMILLY